MTKAPSHLGPHLQWQRRPFSKFSGSSSSTRPSIAVKAERPAARAAHAVPHGSRAELPRVPCHGCRAESALRCSIKRAPATASGGAPPRAPQPLAELPRTRRDMATGAQLLRAPRHDRVTRSWITPYSFSILVCYSEPPWTDLEATEGRSHLKQGRKEPNVLVWSGSNCGDGSSGGARAGRGDSGSS
jgi:hypothetical protein